MGPCLHNQSCKGVTLLCQPPLGRLMALGQTLGAQHPMQGCATGALLELSEQHHCCCKHQEHRSSPKHQSLNGLCWKTT